MHGTRPLDTYAHTAPLCRVRFLPSERFCLVGTHTYCIFHIYLSLPTPASYCIHDALLYSDTSTVPCPPSPSRDTYVYKIDTTLPSSFSPQNAFALLVHTPTAFSISICHSPRPLATVSMLHSTRTRARYHAYLARPQIPMCKQHHFAEFVLPSERFCLVGTHTCCIFHFYLSLPTPASYCIHDASYIVLGHVHGTMPT